MSERIVCDLTINVINSTRMSRTIVYVGGLDESVNEDLLYSAFIPFGDIKSVQVVRDFASSKLTINHSMHVLMYYP